MLPKKKRRFHGIYYHSSPPRVLPMKGEIGNDRGMRRRRDVDDFSVKLSTIRIWMHEKDIGNLTRILWAGQGNRLRQQASTNPKVKRFLAAVPYVMNSIRDVHQSVINSNLESLQRQLEPPVPPALITCKDANGLNVIHKAAGLGHTMMLEHLLSIWPDGVNETDITGKTPLHWAASAKGNMRCYTLLTQAGGNEEALDYKMKTPNYYRQKTNEIERSFLTYVPEAPRVAQDIAIDWEALSDDTGERIKKSVVKIPISANDTLSNSDAASTGNSSEPDLNENSNRVNGDEEEKKKEIEFIHNEIEAEDIEIAGKDEITEEQQPKDKELIEENDEHNSHIDENTNISDDSNGSMPVMVMAAAATAATINNEIEHEERDANGENAMENDEKKVDKKEEQEEEEEKEIRNAKKTAAEERIDKISIEKKQNENEVVNEIDEKPDFEEEIKKTKGEQHENFKTGNVEEEGASPNSSLKSNKESANQEETNQDEVKSKDGDNGENNSSDDNEDGDNDDDEDDDNQDNRESSIRNYDASNAENAHMVTQFDENHNEENKIEQWQSATGTALAIEGFVEGVAEDNQVQSQFTGNDVNNHHEDEENHISELIESGNMEQLAQIVLSGDGEKLLTMNSREPEIQAFLNNVPVYMNKIRRVHLAAREGSLMQLQSALDRRKFAIAKDVISPNGASPLHVAVLFGHSDIVRYLACRFPETISITDDNGRTSLHYAATTVKSDNGHFYNLLVHLGANPEAKDKFGNTTEAYLDDGKTNAILSYGQLLEIFGVEAIEGKTIRNKGQTEATADCLETNPVFKTEQGRYLAKNLSDPLIKGLTEIAEKRPTDPIAYLARYLQNVVQIRNTNNTPASSDTNSTVMINSEDQSSPEKFQNTRISTKNNHVNVDVITNTNYNNRRKSSSVEDDYKPKMDERDEHGQSMLHFACARSHRHNGLFNLIEETHIDITYRDELYRTARDVSLQANQPANAKEIDRYILSLAVVGDVKPFEYFLISGYDHILDIEDKDGESIIDIALSRGHQKLVDFLRNMRQLEELREELHQAIRDGHISKVRDLTAGANGLWMIRTKNYYGRTAIHIAVLKESEEIVEHFVNICPEVLHIGDNLERTVLHYAMGINEVENVCRILIQKGAKRTTKDLKGRQPTYYFMNKADILRLQEEEEEHR